jgi:hypothetical protein
MLQVPLSNLSVRFRIYFVIDPFIAMHPNVVRGRRQTRCSATSGMCARFAFFSPSLCFLHIQEVMHFDASD